MKYIKGLDTLRAFAVIFVIIEHWWIPFDIHSPALLVLIRGLIPDGGFGVDLFFVLSGYLISGILLNAREQNNERKWHTIRNFVIRRSLRIFPVYYATLLILLLIGFPTIKENLVWLVSYTSNILIYRTLAFNAFSHSWSLSVEEQFYLVWPWLLIFINEKYLKFVFAGAIVLGITTTIYTMNVLDNWAGFMLMPSCMQAFGIGGLLAYSKGKSFEQSLSKVINLIFPFALLLHFYFSFSKDHDPQYNCLFLTVNSIISVWLIMKVINNKSEVIRKFLLENRFLNYIGQISYGIYLFHYVLTPIYEKEIVKYFSGSDPVGNIFVDWKYNYPIRLLLLYIIASLSFKYFEKPIINLKKRFEYLS
ncbi:MAG TPA: acyltransferase [Bacteroidia bacterium]|nr:acyltransferase [Bacteroidia bacterium]